VQLELSPAERELLLAVLETALGTLREEIYKTETSDFELALKQREAILKSVIERARACTQSAPRASDLQVEVLDALRDQARVEPGEIAVAIDEGGVVALSGRVPSFAVREAVEAAAFAVPAVRDIADRLEVADRTSYHDLRTDEAIAHDIRRALAAHLGAGEGDIKTSVSHGVVALHGNVDTWQMAAEAEAAAVEVVGVVDVEDDRVVRPAALAPQTLEMNVGEALEQHAGHPLENIEVHVEGGIVTLTGPISSWAERDMALEVARLVPGVQDVHDRLHLRAFRTAW
jgi:osmotically-inducible protein OsmY